MPEAEARGGPEAEVRGGLASDVLSGSGLGLLLGTVMGLTTAPVVAGVVGGITSLLAVFLGLDGGGEGKLGGLLRVRLNGVRIGCFGLAAVVGVALGLYVRINNPLAESPKAQLDRWELAFPDNHRLAREMMVYERTRLKPAALSFDPSGPATGVTAGEGADATAAVLYSVLKGADNCRALAPSRYGDDVDKLLDAYDNRGGPLSVVATRVRALPPQQQAAALDAVRTLLCELEKPEP